MPRLKKNPEEKAINKSISFRIEDFERITFLSDVFHISPDKLSAIVQRSLEHSYNFYKQG